jgi:2-oxo-4-hydroxy-4-carboxy--5-ureidoimidazoline (OHCU) decarboxylase
MDLPGADALNALSPSAFADALAPLFEGAPGFLRRLAGSRPFDSDAALLTAAREVAASTPEAELVELLDDHPRIGADPAEMSMSSRDEQEDGEVLGDALAQELADLNAAYEQRFGFRYVVFVAGRPRAAIAPLIEVALRNEREAELRRGVDDAIYIASDRLRVLRGASDGSEEVGS